MTIKDLKEFLSRYDDSYTIILYNADAELVLPLSGFVIDSERGEIELFSDEE